MAHRLGGRRGGRGDVAHSRDTWGRRPRRRPGPGPDQADARHAGRRATGASTSPLLAGTTRACSIGALLLVLLPPAAAHGADAPTCDGLAATVVGTEGDDDLTGTDGPDVVVGLGGDDRLAGLGGADRLCGGDGRDVLNGGGGDDHLDPGPPPSSGLDQLRWNGSPRGITVDLGDGAAGSAAGWGHDELVLTTRTVVVGSAHGDTVVGSPLADRVRVGRGGDRVLAGGGGDQVWLDNDRRDRSVDVLRAGAGGDVVTSSAGADRVGLGAGRDSFNGSGGTVPRVHGGPGHDFLLVEVRPGRPVALRGGRGHDDVALAVHVTGDPRVLVDAARGELRFPGRPGAASVVAGFDWHLLLGAARFRFRGTDGPDTVLATGYEERLVADTRGGDDVVEGSHRDDVLDGGPGRDRVHGNGGRDRCLRAEVRSSCERLR